MNDEWSPGPADRVHRSRLWNAPLLLILLAGTAGCGEGQQGTPMSAVSAQLMVTLGDDEEGLVGNFFAIARDSQGRYLIAYPEYGSVIAVFDEEGSYVETFGRSGRGPGEFLWVDKIRVIGDQIHVFDTPAHRRTVLDLDFRVVETSPLPAQAIDVEVLSDSLLVVNSSIWSDDRIGYPIHLVDLQGRVRRSVGHLGGESRGTFLTSDLRPLARESHDRFWSIHSTRFVLELWDLEGQNLDRIELERPWLDPYEGVCCTISPEHPPEPRIRQLQRDSEGRLWVLSTVAADEWSEGVVPSDDGYDGAQWIVGDYDLFYDTVVEVIDPEAGEVIASGRFDPWFQNFVDEGLVASYVPHRPGEGPRIRVWELSLQIP